MKPRKKISIGVLTEIVSSHSGARAPLEIAAHLRDLGHDVTVYAYETHQDEVILRYLICHGVRIITIAKPKFSRYIAIPDIYRRLKKNTHQVLYFSGTPPFFIAGLLSLTPIVRMYQGTQFDAYLEKFLPNQKIPIFHKWINAIFNCLIYVIELMSFRLSEAVVAISHFAANEGKILYKRKVFKIIYHGSNSFLLPARKSPITKIIKLISVSRITPYKGFHLLIDALKKIPVKFRWHLTIVGSQPKLAYISYLKQLHRKNISIQINVSDQKLARLYALSHLYVTCDRYLYFGLPIFEAAHFGLPAIVFNYAAANEVVINRVTGLIVNNQTELSRCIKEVIEQPALRQKLGIQAKKRAQKFSWTICAKEWEKVLMRFAKT